MASFLLYPPALSTTSRFKRHRIPLSAPAIQFLSFQQKPTVTRPYSLLLFPSSTKPNYPQITVTNGSLTTNEKNVSWAERKPVKFFIGVVLWASLYIGLHALSGDIARAAALDASDSVRTSLFGVKVANALRALGWPDEAVVIALATLPVVELRGAIPVGYWLQLTPLKLTLLSILGNMIPVPFIILYLKKVATFFTGKNETASRFLDVLFERAKQKADPVKEFQWLGLMLFVAVPFPGTGAWTGAFIASILDMPFWPAVSANFFGVVLAGLLVNLLVSLGLKYAVLTGIVLFVISTFMWSILRSLKNSFAMRDQIK